MNDKEKREKIVEILIAQEKQTKVDTIQIVEKSSIKDENRDKAYKSIGNYLVKKRKRRLFNR